MGPEDVTESVSNNLRSRLVSGGAWAVAAKLVGAVAVLGLNAAFARLLSQDELGTYFLVFSIVSVLAVVGQFGLTQTVVRLISEARSVNDRAAILGVLRRIFLVGATTSLSVAILTASEPAARLFAYLFHDIALSRFGTLMAVWIVVTVAMNITAESFRGLHDIRVASIMISLVTPVVALLVTALMVLAGVDLSVEVVLGVMILATSANLAGGGTYLQFRLRHSLSTHVVGEAIEVRTGRIVSIALPLLIHNLAAFVLAQADIWLVGALLTAGDVAVYGAAARLAALVYLPLLVANSVLPPMISEMYMRNNPASMQRVLRLSATVTLFVAASGFGLIVIFPGMLLEFVYGVPYAEGAVVLVILSGARVVSVAAGSCGITLTMTGHQREIMWCTLAGGSLAVVGAASVATRFGIKAVALAMAVGLIGQNLAMLMVVRRKLGIWTYAALSPTTIKQCARDW